tara:strand:+ start:1088 stop:1246 length:159 start_codon:yes stop_codon:yes gene_type:complete
VIEMATREQKIKGANKFKQLIRNGNGRKRTIDDMYSSYRTVMKRILKGSWGK